MPYLLNAEQQLLQEQVRGLLTEKATADVLRRLITEDVPWDEGLWEALAGLGVLGAGIPEAYGGVGLGAMEIGVIAEEVGRAVAPVPFFSSVCLASEALLIAGSEAQKSEWLPKLAAGARVGTLAWTEGPTPPSLRLLEAELVDGRLQGVKSPVPDAGIADVCIVVAKSAGEPVLALVELDQPGVEITRLKGIDQLRHQYRVEFSGASAQLMDATDGAAAADELLNRAAIYQSFEQVGAAEGALLMARDYTLQRYIFGRQLASFQAIKHSLANIFRSWDLAKCNALHAAQSLASRAPDLGAAAATARIAANQVYDTVARENLQFHGGIGFTWEADCHFHYRRARLLALNLGSTEFWVDRLMHAIETQQYPAPSGRDAKRPARQESAEDAEYRARARAWIAENASATSEATDDQAMAEEAMAWTKRKHQAGYSAIDQPSELGGAGGTRRQARIFAEEEASAGVTSYMGASYVMAMAAIRGHGTRDQREKWETMTHAGEILWCQLFSEPAAGSDLAAVRTKAVRDGDHWIVNGQKVWTSGGTHCNYGILLARTDPGVPKHAGLSFFIIDMHQPGVTVRPIRQINGLSNFTETFLEDAVVPDEYRLGEVGDGWKVAMTVLAHERNTAGMGGGGAGTRRRSSTSARSLIKLAQSSPRDRGTAFDSAAVRGRIAHFHMEAQGIRAFSQRLAEQLASGGPPPTNIPVMKLTTTNRLQQIEAFLMDLQEAGGVVQDAADEDDKFIGYLSSASIRIAGGADEVLRNQLAERALGMPGEVRADKDVPFAELPY